MAVDSLAIARWLHTKWGDPAWRKKLGKRVEALYLLTDGINSKEVDSWLTESLSDDVDEIASIVWESATAYCDEKRRGARFVLAFRAADGEWVNRMEFVREDGLRVHDTGPDGVVGESLKHLENMMSTAIKATQIAMADLTESNKQMRMALSACLERERLSVERDARVQELVAEVAASSEGPSTAMERTFDVFEKYLAAGGAEQLVGALGALQKPKPKRSAALARREKGN